MRYNLLKIVQSVLGAIRGGSVNDISETEESRRIAGYAQDEYYRLTADFDWQNLTGTIQLDGLGDITRPNYLSIPENVVKVNEFQYEVSSVGDAKRVFKDIEYLTPQEFIDRTSRRDTTASNVTTVREFGGILLFIRNDIAPSYWTSFDDRYIVTDSYDSAIEITLHQQKTLSLGELILLFQVENEFIPPIQSRLFPAYLSSVKSKAFSYIKQTESSVDLVDAKVGKFHQYGKEGVTNGKKIMSPKGRRSRGH